MKLYEYRLTSEALQEIPNISLTIQEFFKSKADLEFTAITAGERPEGGVRRAAIQITALANALKCSLEYSLGFNSGSGVPCSIKSNESCRFIVFEDDGLVRICYASDDDIIEFDGISCEPRDSSNLLIETDLFDFL